MEPMTEEQEWDRANIIWGSDAVCPCGADPRAGDGDAIYDPAWHIDAVQTPDATYAEVYCPACLSGRATAGR